MTAAEICEETHVFPKLNELANPSRLVLDMQIVMPRGELQVHVAKDNGILRDEFKGNLVDGRNNSKYRDVAPLNGIPINHIFECV